MTDLTDRAVAALITTDGDALATLTDPETQGTFGLVRRVLDAVDRAATAEGLRPEMRARVVNRVVLGHPDPLAAYGEGEVLRQVACVDDMDDPQHPAVQALAGIGRHLEHEHRAPVMAGHGAGSPLQAAHDELRGKVTAALGLDADAAVGDIVAAVRALTARVGG